MPRIKRRSSRRNRSLRNRTATVSRRRSGVQIKIGSQQLRNGSQQLRMTRKRKIGRIGIRSRRHRLRTPRHRYAHNVSTNQTLELPYELQNLFPISIRSDRLGGLQQRMSHWYKYMKSVQGTDGRNINRKHWIHLGRLANSSGLKRGEIGCYWAHREAWGQIVNRKLSMGLIVEDDINFVYTEHVAHRLQAFFEDLRNNPVDWDVIYLGHFNKGPYRNENLQFGSTRLMRSLACDGCMMYLISNRGAQFLYEHSLPMNVPVDILFQHQSVAGNVLTYSWQPRLCFCVGESSDTGSIM